MIFVKFGGRLGNQLFQYAFARYLQKKYYPEDSLVFNFDLVEKQGSIEDGWRNSLTNFNIVPNKISKYPRLNLIQIICCAFYYLGNRLSFKLKQKDDYDIKMQPYLNRVGIYSLRKTAFFPVEKNKYFKNQYIRGRFEAKEYCDAVRSELLKEICPIKEILPHNELLYNKIRNTDSVCITIRRGDFLKPENRAFNVCSKEYFYRGVEYIKSHVECANFFVFSDDINWVKNNMKFPDPVEYENNEGKDPVWEKLRLMSACKYFVISNSTFSWWVQYLSNYEKKIVVAPKIWRIDENCSGLYSDEFVLLDT